MASRPCYLRGAVAEFQCLANGKWQMANGKNGKYSEIRGSVFFYKINVPMGMGDRRHKIL